MAKTAEGKRLFQQRAGAEFLFPLAQGRPRGEVSLEEKGKGKEKEGKISVLPYHPEGEGELSYLTFLRGEKKKKKIIPRSTAKIKREGERGGKGYGILLHERPKARLFFPKPAIKHPLATSKGKKGVLFRKVAFLILRKGKKGDGEKEEKRAFFNARGASL